MKKRIVYGHEQKRGTDGRKVCKVCESTLPKYRRSYCSHECELRNTPSMIRHAVERRDKCVCAICGIQCKQKKSSYDYGAMTQAERDVLRKQPEWQADHIIPVAEGGGLCGLEGYRTLCLPCHKKESAALVARLAVIRRQSKSLPLIDSMEASQ